MKNWHQHQYWNHQSIKLPPVTLLLFSEKLKSMITDSHPIRRARSTRHYNVVSYHSNKLKSVITDSHPIRRARPIRHHNVVSYHSNKLKSMITDSQLCDLLWHPVRRARLTIHYNVLVNKHYNVFCFTENLS